MTPDPTLIEQVAAMLAEWGENGCEEVPQDLAARILAMRATTPTAPVQDDDAEDALVQQLRNMALQTDDPDISELWDQAADRINVLRSRLSPTPETGLVEALTPLVEKAGWADRQKAVWGKDWHNGRTVSISLGTCRKVRALLSNVLPDEV